MCQGQGQHTHKHTYTSFFKFVYVIYFSVVAMTTGYVVCLFVCLFVCTSDKCDSFPLIVHMMTPCVCAQSVYTISAQHTSTRTIPRINYLG